MRLALIRQRYTPFGGAERFMDRAIHALGHEAEITVLAREWRGEAAGYRFIECNPPARGNVARDRSFAVAVRSALARETFDLIQSHERIVPEGITAPFLYRAGDGVHATWLAERARHNGWAGRLRNAVNPYHRYMVAEEAAMFRHPNLTGVICNSQMVRDDIAARFGLPASRLHVIYNGVDLSAYTPATLEQKAKTRSHHGFLADRAMLLYVGSGFERKGVGNLLRAFARADAGMQLAIVGGDKHLARYQALAARLGVADRVRFTGAVQDVKPWYAAADAFVLPTLYDPMPNAALEALACGLPLLTTPACGAAELVQEGINGFVRDAADVDGLAAGMTRLARQAPSGTQLGAQSGHMGAAARASVEHLSLDAMAQRLLTLYRSLLPHG